MISRAATSAGRCLVAIIPRVNLDRCEKQAIGWAHEGMKLSLARITRERLFVERTDYDGWYHGTYGMESRPSMWRRSSPLTRDPHLCSLTDERVGKGEKEGGTTALVMGQDICRRRP
jgi:hypothetical protein